MIICTFLSLVFALKNPNAPEDELSSIVDETLLKYTDAVNDYKNGKDKALNYLLGQIYKRTKNNIDSIKVKEILLNKLEEK